MTSLLTKLNQLFSSFLSLHLQGPPGTDGKAGQKVQYRVLPHSFAAYGSFIFYGNVTYTRSSELCFEIHKHQQCKRLCLL